MYEWCIFLPLVELQQEIILTRQLQHPNVISYFASFVSGPEVCVVSPLLSFGSCKDLLRNHFSEGTSQSHFPIITE